VYELYLACALGRVDIINMVISNWDLEFLRRDFLFPHYIHEYDSRYDLPCCTSVYLCASMSPYVHCWRSPQALTALCSKPGYPPPLIEYLRAVVFQQQQSAQIIRNAFRCIPLQIFEEPFSVDVRFRKCPTARLLALYPVCRHALDLPTFSAEEIIHRLRTLYLIVLALQVGKSLLEDPIVQASVVTLLQSLLCRGLDPRRAPPAINVEQQTYYSDFSTDAERDFFAPCCIPFDVSRLNWFRSAPYALLRLR